MSRRWIGLAVALLLVVVYFAVADALDLPVSFAFYRPGEGFFLADRLPLRIVYQGTRWFILIVSAGLLCALAWSWLPACRWDRAWRGRIGFLLLSLAVGPGLITNTLFKDHWGRPRPQQLIEFGGTAQYVPPLVPSSQCTRNCSFPSGHASAAFWLISGAWVWPHRRRTWLAVGVTAGAIVGFTRIAQGGHFLSDVLASLAVVWLVDEALSRWARTIGWLQETPG